MAKKEKNPGKSENKTIEGLNVVGELEKFRDRTKDAKLKAKVDEIHDIFMAVKPGPVSVRSSGGWLSYLSGKLRFAALEVRKSFIRIHSIELNDSKMSCEIIKVTANDKVPVEKIRLRAEGFITDKLKIAKARE